MRNKFLLCNVIFILSLIILLLNDHFLKLYFHNWFTGKLSDVVGIILLPFLLAFVFPKLRHNSVYFTALFFIFWKSPYSEKLIEIYNLVSPISIHRVVDYTDLLTFIFLFIPYYFIKNQQQLSKIEIRRASPIFILIPGLLILMSTSPPRYYEYVPYTGNITFSNFNVTIKNKSSDEVLNELKIKNIAFRKDTVRIISKNRIKLIAGGKIETFSINSKKELFQISQDTLKEDVKELVQNSNWFIVDSLKLEDEIVKNIQFEIGTYQTNKGKESIITIHGLTTSKNLNDNSVIRRLKKLYRNSIKNEFKNF